MNIDDTVRVILPDGQPATVQLAMTASDQVKVVMSATVHGQPFYAVEFIPKLSIEAVEDAIGHLVKVMAKARASSPRFACRQVSK